MEPTALKTFLDKALADSKIISTDLCPKPAPVVNIVIGNETCDLDSAVCSVVYAHFLQWVKSKSESADDAQEEIFMPIFNIPRKEITVKTEVLYYLKKNNIDPNVIVCRDDIKFEELVKNFKIVITLVDHHVLKEEEEYLLSHVVQIFDHRPIDAYKLGGFRKMKRSMELVGSCATLICSEILKNEANREFFAENHDSARLLLGAIILDTVNFLPSAEKAKPLDIEMAEVLLEILGVDDRESYRRQLFDELLQARMDHSELSTAQLLIRDIKFVGNLPIAGLPMLVRDFLRRENIQRELIKFCEEDNYPGVILMGLRVVNDSIFRDLAVFSNDGADFKLQMEAILRSWECPNLELVEEDCDLIYGSYFVQGNTKASRKQIIPIIRSVI